MVIDNPVRSAVAENSERSPQATRVGRSRWLNPQVIIGLILVLGATALGARIVAAADDTIAVLSAATDLRPGQPLTDDAVEVRHVRLDDALEHYHSGEVGAGYVVVRPVDRGELIPVSAVAAADEVAAADVRYLSLSLPSEEVPRSLVTGSIVDVWLTPADDATRRTATAVARGVTVAAADADGGALGIEGSRTSVTLAVGPPHDGPDREAPRPTATPTPAPNAEETPASGTPAPSATDAKALDTLVSTLVGAARDGRVYLVLRPDAVTAP